MGTHKGMPLHRTEPPYPCAFAGVSVFWVKPLGRQEGCC